jgi:hypothetical protein
MRQTTTMTIARTRESDARNPSDFLNLLVTKLAKERTGQSVVIDLSALADMNSVDGARRSLRSK